MARTVKTTCQDITGRTRVTAKRNLWFSTALGHGRANDRLIVRAEKRRAHHPRLEAPDATPVVEDRPDFLGRGVHLLCQFRHALCVLSSFSEFGNGALSSAAPHAAVPPEDCFEVLRQRELVIGTAKGCRAPRAMWLVVPEVFGDISREGRVDLVSGEMIDVGFENTSQPIGSMMPRTCCSVDLAARPAAHPPGTRCKSPSRDQEKQANLPSQRTSSARNPADPARWQGSPLPDRRPFRKSRGRDRGWLSLT